MGVFNRKEGYKNAIGSHTQAKLTKIRVIMFQLLIKMYELIAEENICLVEWTDNGVVNNQAQWMQIFHLQLIPNSTSIKGGILCQMLHLPSMKCRYMII